MFDPQGIDQSLSMQQKDFCFVQYIALKERSYSRRWASADVARHRCQLFPPTSADAQRREYGRAFSLHLGYRHATSNTDGQGRALGVTTTHSSPIPIPTTPHDLMPGTHGTLKAY